MNDARSCRMIEHLLQQTSMPQTARSRVDRLEDPQSGTRRPEPPKVADPVCLLDVGPRIGGRLANVALDRAHGKVPGAAVSRSLTSPSPTRASPSPSPPGGAEPRGTRRQGGQRTIGGTNGHADKPRHAGDDSSPPRMKGCVTCGRIWAPTMAPDACPECHDHPKSMGIPEISSLILARQRRLRETLRLRRFNPGAGDEKAARSDVSGRSRDQHPATKIAHEPSRDLAAMLAEV
jgi:hypothetical protein